MSDTTGVLLLFILVGGIILLVLLLRARSGTGRLKVGAAELYIDFNNSPGWVLAKPVSRLGQPAALTGPYLTVRNTRWRYPLDGSTVYIGRGPDNQIRLRDTAAAARQAVIYWEDGRYKINNLAAGSYAPTRVNGRPITRQNLGDGNTIQLGHTKMIFRGRHR